MVVTIRRLISQIGIFFLVILSLPAFADINEIEIRILPESVVYQEYYTLGDIAELNGFDVETIQQLAKVEIGKAPLPGRSYIISRGAITRRLKGKFNDNNLNLIVPKKPSVSRASLKINAKQLKDIVLNEIKNHYTQYDDIKITIKTRLNDIFIPKGDASYKIKRIGKSNKIGGYSSWMLTFTLDEKPVKKVMVRAKVDVFNNVLVAKDVISKGSKIEDTDLKEVKKNISREQIGFQSNNELIVGKHARRDILENEAIKKNLVGNPILVEKGMPVKVILKTKNLMLSNLATAMKAGRKGDIIPVKTIGSKKILYTVIIDSKKVEIAL